jgi:hypothetical protein
MAGETHSAWHDPRVCGRLKARLSTQRPPSLVILYDLALPLQLLQDLNDTSFRRLPQTLWIILIYDFHNVHARPPQLFLLGEHIENLLLALLAVLDILTNLCRPFLNDRTVTGVCTTGELFPHLLEALHVHGEVLKHGGALAQHVVCGEHGVFFFEHERHVIGCVARTVEGAECCAFGGEGLAVGYGPPITIPI